MATFYIILHTMAGRTFIDDRHFASIPFLQIMDGRVTRDALVAALDTMDTSHEFLGFRLMAGSTIYLRRYVDFPCMLFNIYDVYMTASARIGAMSRVCKLLPVDGASVTFQTISRRKGSLHVDVDCKRSEFSEGRGGTKNHKEDQKESHKNSPSFLILNGTILHKIKGG